MESEMDHGMLASQWGDAVKALNAQRERAEKAEAEVIVLRGDLAKWDHNGGRVGCNHEGGICCRFDGYKRRAEAAEAALTSEREAHAGLRARLEALADEVDGWTPYDSRDTGETFLAESVREFVADLRAALAAEPAEATASRPPETSGAGSIAPVAAEEGGEQEAGEERPVPEFSPRSHNSPQCSCGAPDAYSLNPAEMIVHSVGDCYVAPAPSGSDEQGNRTATPDANGVHDTKGGDAK